MKDEFYKLVVLSNRMLLGDDADKSKEYLRGLIPIINNSGFDYIDDVSLNGFLMRGGLILVALNPEKWVPIGCMGLFYDGIHHHLMFQSIVEEFRNTKLSHYLVKDANDLINESKKVHNCDIQMLWISKLNRSPTLIVDNLTYEKVKKIDFYIRRSK